MVLPDAPPTPIGSFRNVRQSGDLVFISGQGPVEADGTLLCGKVGDDVSAEAARDHARLVAINILAALRHDLGWPRRGVGGREAARARQHDARVLAPPFVIDGASDLLAEVFGPDGVHARSSFGVASLPNQITVEIEAIFELREPR